MFDHLEHLDLSEIRPFSGETNYEKRSRESIRSSTHKDLLDQKKQYETSLKNQNALKQNDESTSEMLSEILTRLLHEVQIEIQKKYTTIKERTQNISPTLSGDVPEGWKSEKIQILPSGKVYLGFKNSTPRKQDTAFSRTNSGGMYITYDEYLSRAQGKKIEIDDITISLSWRKDGTPELRCEKRAREPKEEEIPNTTLSNQEQLKSLKSAQLILASLREKITKDNSPLANKIFQGRRPSEVDLSRMTYASGEDVSSVRYAQVMEDRGRVYTAWGEVVGGERPLIIVDQRNHVMLFSGKINIDNQITPDPGFTWPKSRDIKSYRFQPIINLKWIR